MGTARFTLTLDDLIAAQKAWWMGAARWQTFLKWAAALGVIYAALALAMTWQAPWAARIRAMGYGVLIGVALVIVLLLIGYLRAPHRARRAFREHKALKGEFIYEWDAEGTTISHEHGTTRLPWTLLHEWAVGPRTLMLFQTHVLFNAIPLRALGPGDVDRIVDDLRAAGVRERRRFGVLPWRQRETAVR